MLTVKDLKVPEGVRVLNDPNQAVATVAPPAAEEPAVVAAVTTEATAAEPEVLTERKPKEGEAAEADAKDKGGGRRSRWPRPSSAWGIRARSIATPGTTWAQRVVDALAHRIHARFEREGGHAVAAGPLAGRAPLPDQARQSS